MFGINVPNEVWSALIIITFFLLYPIVFKGSIEKGILKGRKVLIVISFLLSAFSLFLCYDWISGRFESEHDFYYLAFLTTVLFGGAIYFFGEGYLVKGKFDENRIVFQTPWSGKKECPWCSLREVNFSSTSNCYILEFEDGIKIRISTFLLGYLDLINHVRTLGFKVEDN
ncbi:MAG: hypothetical protein HRT54_04970 [Colwellia sp.]|nr:hypothetical protein [Colwellia sp.]